MTVSSYYGLRQHVGHRLACVTYGDNENVAVECEECNVVLMDFNETEDDRADRLRRQAQRREDELAEQTLREGAHRGG